MENSILIIMGIAGIAMIVFIMIFVGNLSDAKRRQCPKCKKWGARQLTKNRILEEASDVKHETDYAVDSSTGDTVSRTREVYITITTCQKHYVCKHCRHTWMVTTKEEA